VEFKATANNLRISPQKLGLLADMVRGKKVQVAVDSLKFTDKKWAKNLVSLIHSAVNNASQNRGVNVDSLYVKRIYVDQATTLKRFMTRARGGASRILKRSSHISVILDEKK